MFKMTNFIFNQINLLQKLYNRIQSLYLIIKQRILKFKQLFYIEQQNNLILSRNTQMTDKVLKEISFSPYNVHNQGNTNKCQTTSYKKYPVNKYYNQINPSQIKSQLFVDETPFQMKSIYNQHKNFEILQRNHKNALNSVSYQNRYPYNNKISLNMSSINQNMIPINNKNTSKSRVSLAKHPLNVTKNSKKHKKSNLTSTKIQIQNKIEIQKGNEQLEHYKRLCLDLRKNNQQLQANMSRQNKKSSKFNSQIQQLKHKVRIMYDYCIQKNKSAKNVDSKLKFILQNYKQNRNTNDQILKRPNGSLKNRSKSFDMKLSKKGYKRTIDSVKTTYRQRMNLSSINLNKQSLNFKDSISRNLINQSEQKQKFESNRLSSEQRYAKKYQYDNQQLFDNQKSEKIQKNHQNQKQQNYKQFFDTFMKSLQIFNEQKTITQKFKIKSLHDAVYKMQYAKKQWLQIVEFLIKKGYIINSKQKRIR